MDTLSLDTILKTIRDFEDRQPQFNNSAIDEMISNGNKIEELAMIHSMPELRDIHKIKTNHGYIEAKYTSPLYLEYGSALILKKPNNPLSFIADPAVLTPHRATERS